PHVRARAGQFDVAETLATHLRLRYFDAALVADHSAMLHSLVLSAQTFPISDGTEDAGAEETVAFRFERAVVYRFRLGHFAARPRSYLFRRSQRNPDRLEIRRQILFFLHPEQSLTLLS